MAKLRIEGGHGIVSNTILNHASISLKEEGLYAYIQSKPNGRKFSAERIAKSHSDGIDSVKSGLVGLQKKGLLSRTKVRLRNGTWDREYCLHATFVIPTTVENPPMDNPPVEKPSAEKPPIKKTRDSKQEIVNKNKTILDKSNIDEQSSFEKNQDDFLPGKDENISTTPQPPSKEFGDKEINLCISIIKEFNKGAINGSNSDQRIWSRHLISKLKGLPKVTEGKMDRSTALRSVLKRISSNTYHCHKIGGPQSIYEKWGDLTQIALNTSPLSDIEIFINGLPSNVKQIIEVRNEKMKELGKVWENIDQIRTFLQSKGISKKSVEVMIDR